MRSQFSAQTLAEIFRDLYLGERSGTLTLHRNETEKRVYFDRGMILYAESSVEDEDLGMRLVREGKLSAGALAEARDSLNGASGSESLALALVRRELIARTTVAAEMRSIVECVVESVFRWEGGSARFTENACSSTIFETDVLATSEVILKGVFCMAGFEPIHEAMQALDNRFRIRRPCPIPLERLPLSAAHGFILSRVDGNSSLKDVISVLPPGEEEVAVRFLFGLLVLGVLEYDPELSKGPFKVADILRDHKDLRALEQMQEQLVRQTYAQIREQNPYEILGVSPSTSLPEIEQAYEMAKSKFSRERVLPRVRQKYRSELTVIESRLIEAYLKLTQPARGESAEDSARIGTPVTIQDLNVRVEMDKAKSKQAIDEANRVADAYYAKGRKCMRDADFHNAIQYGKLAISHNPSDARYYYLLADCQARNPEARWQRMAEENLTKATELDPWNAEYWIRLGRLYKSRGLKLRARKQFEEALKLVPNNREILEELEGLT